MASINIANRPSSSKNHAPKKFAKKKGGRMTKAENKFRKPVLTQKKSVSIATSKAIGREIAQSISKGWKKKKTKVMYLYTLFMY